MSTQPTVLSDLSGPATAAADGDVVLRGPRPVGPVPQRRGPGQRRQRAELRRAGWAARWRSWGSPARASRVSSMSVLGLHNPKRTLMSGSILLDGRRSSAPRRRSCRRSAAARVAMVFQDPQSSLHPFYRIGNQIAEAYRAHHQRVQGRGDEACRGDARPGRHPEPRPPRPQLPARVLRRHAPARDDRDGPGQQPQAADRRRADHGPGRHRPGADPRPAQGPAARVRLGDRADHPRPRRSWPRSPTTSWSCTPVAPSSAAWPRRSSRTRCTPTPGACCRACPRPPRSRTACARSAAPRPAWWRSRPAARSTPAATSSRRSAATPASATLPELTPAPGDGSRLTRCHLLDPRGVLNEEIHP